MTDPRIAVLSALSSPGWHPVPEAHGMPWDEAVALLDAYDASRAVAPAAAPSAPADRAALRERVIGALREARRPGLGSMTEADAVAYMADAVLAVLPEPADRAAILREAATDAERDDAYFGVYGPRVGAWLRRKAEQEPTPAAAADPVKQRADLTETEWAQQERARFERLYTRETVRADLAEQRAGTAARDADIYQRRLERLSEGYTEQRKRAEKAEADANHNADLVADAVQRAEQAEAAVERVRSVLESEAVVGRSALDYRGLITSALMADDAPGPSRMAGEAQQPETQGAPFSPPAHYRGRDGTAYCVHAIPVGPDSCRECRDLAEHAAAVSQPETEA